MRNRSVGKEKWIKKSTTKTNMLFEISVQQLEERDIISANSLAF